MIFCGNSKHHLAGMAKGAFAILAVMLTVFSAQVQAQVILDTGGFEGYALGQLEGQTQGMLPNPIDTWLRPGGSQLGTGTVQSSVAKDGSQAVQIDRVAQSDDRYAVSLPDSNPGRPNYPSIGALVCVEWDMLVDGPRGVVGEFGPLFGVEAYDDKSPVSIGLAGSILVDATTGDVLYQAAETGVLTETGEKIVFNEWHHYNLVLDYVAKTYDVYFDGVLLKTEGFVDEANVTGGLNQFTDADLAALAGDLGASDALTGSAYFDNFIIHEGAICIPEPTAVVLSVLSLLTLATRRRC